MSHAKVSQSPCLIHPRDCDNPWKFYDHFEDLRDSSILVKFTSSNMKLLSVLRDRLIDLQGTGNHTVKKILFIDWLIYKS